MLPNLLDTNLTIYSSCFSLYIFLHSQCDSQAHIHYLLLQSLIQNKNGLHLTFFSLSYMAYIKAEAE